MLCRSCSHNSRRIMVVNGIDRCPNCALMTDTGGASVDGSITRNSHRVRIQQREMAEDMQPAYVYDKTTRKVVPNKQFIQSFPNEVNKTFTNDELKSVGITKLKGRV